MGLFGFGKKKEKQGKYGDGNTTDPNEALSYLLHEVLHGNFAVKDIVEENHIYLPDWELTITPVVAELTNEKAVLNFYLYSPHFKKQIHETCASVGEDPKQAMGMAIASFLFSCMSGITKLFQKELAIPLETEFAGNSHHFNVYISDILEMGESSKVEDIHTYWELLKDDIKKRLGNQHFCYVKIYCSKLNDHVTCECRINDIVSDELSAKLTKQTEAWNVENFASLKQFFFIEQHPDTIQPYPYWGEQGEKEFIRKVITAVKLFHTSDTQEAFDTLQERLVNELGDTTLAAECRLFLPEICAEYAFGEQMQFSETLDFLFADGTKHSFYKHQLADYYALSDTLFTAFQQNIFGDETDLIYRELIGCSAIYNVIQQAKEKGSELSNCRLTGLLFQVDENFKIR